MEQQYVFKELLLNKIPEGTESNVAKYWSQIMGVTEDYALEKLSKSDFLPHVFGPYDETDNTVEVFCDQLKSLSCDVSILLIYPKVVERFDTFQGDLVSILSDHKKDIGGKIDTLEKVAHNCDDNVNVIREAIETLKETQGAISEELETKITSVNSDFNSFKTEQNEFNNGLKSLVQAQYLVVNNNIQNVEKVVDTYVRTYLESLSKNLLEQFQIAVSDFETVIAKNNSELKANTDIVNKASATYAAIVSEARQAALDAIASESTQEDLRLTLNDAISKIQSVEQTCEKMADISSNYEVVIAALNNATSALATASQNLTSYYEEFVKLHKAERATRIASNSAGSIKDVVNTITSLVKPKEEYVKEL